MLRAAARAASLSASPTTNERSGSVAPNRLNRHRRARLAARALHGPGVRAVDDVGQEDAFAAQRFGERSRLPAVLISGDEPFTDQVLVGDDDEGIPAVAERA